MSVVEIAERIDDGNFPIFFFHCLAASALCCSEFPRVLAGSEMEFQRDSRISVSLMGFVFCLFKVCL